MTSRTTSARRLTSAAGRLWRRWHDDRSGATLAQFVLVLPVLVLVVVGMYAIFTVYSARQTLCEAVWEATRYLQVEGPQLDPDDYIYPQDWEAIALQIINQELASNRMTQFPTLTQEDVEITPNIRPTSPEEMSEVSADFVERSWFFIRATAQITNPMAAFVEGKGEGNALALSCKGTGFYEGPPIGPTPGPGGGSKPINCPRPPICSPGPPPSETPEGTPPPTCPPCRTPRGR